MTGRLKGSRTSANRGGMASSEQRDMKQIIQKAWDVHRNESKNQHSKQWHDDTTVGGSAQRSAGQRAYALGAIPGTGFPVLRPVEGRRPYAGTRGQGGHGGRDGLIWLGKGRPRGCRVFLLRITQGMTGQRDTWCHHARSGRSASGSEFWPTRAWGRETSRCCRRVTDERRSYGPWVGRPLSTWGRTNVKPLVTSQVTSQLRVAHTHLHPRGNKTPKTPDPFIYCNPPPGAELQWWSCGYQPPCIYCGYKELKEHTCW